MCAEGLRQERRGGIFGAMSDTDLFWYGLVGFALWFSYCVYRLGLEAGVRQERLRRREFRNRVRAGPATTGEADPTG